MDNMIWIAFFSQTGKEIADLSYKLNRWPDYVAYNESSKLKICTALENRQNLDPKRIIFSNKPVLEEYTNFLSQFDKSKILITLHGYLRIIPAEICDNFTIYNGHPGLITRYPELKGADPQEKVWKDSLKYPVIGSVVHKCTDILDGGVITNTCETTNIAHSKDQLYNLLRQTSLDAWNVFLRNRLK